MIHTSDDLEGIHNAAIWSGEELYPDCMPLSLQLRDAFDNMMEDRRAVD